MDEFTIVIEVRGGCVTAVFKQEDHSADPSVYVRDWDNIEAGDEDILEGIDLSETPGAVCVW